ncbi:MAG TPA: carbohydrate kinase family protein [Candidatus Limnocylindria bacterium]|nr:carbohydrate kinase family protein [Candidatus Limnocylindria bacterium]
MISATGEVHYRQCGGNAYYAAVGMRLWAQRVGIVSRVGSDYPTECLNALGAAGIDTSGIQKLDRPHALAAGYQYDARGHRRLVDPSDHARLNEQAFFRGEWDERSAVLRVSEDIRQHFDPQPADLPPSFRSARGFHIANMGHRAQLAYLSLLQGKVLSLDAGDPDLAPAEQRSLFGAADLFLPSEIQARAIVGGSDENLPRAMIPLTRLGPSVVAVKAGRHGSWVHDSKAGRTWHIPAVASVSVQDPTGAGDAYCGGFLAAFVAGNDALESGLRATVSASFVIEAFDVRHGLGISSADAEARLAELRPRVSEATPDGSRRS